MMINCIFSSKIYFHHFQVFQKKLPSTLSLASVLVWFSCSAYLVFALL